MKRYWKYLWMAAFLLFPLNSYSSVDGFRINTVVAFFQANDECAVEGEVTASQGGLINGTEKLTINGQGWGDFSQLPIAPNYGVGVSLSFGTPALAVKLNYAFDVPLDPGICQNLKGGDTLGFTGSQGTQLSDIVLPNPTLNGAWGLNNNVYEEIDLTQNSISITGWDGSSTTFGTGPLFVLGGGMNVGGGGCMISETSASSGTSTFLVSMATVSMLALLRRRALRSVKSLP